MLSRCLRSRVGNWTLALFILACLNFRAYRSLAWITAGFITGAEGDGPRGTLLALSPNRFRGDLDVLEKAGYRVLRLDPNWVARITTLIFNLPIKPEVVFLNRDTLEVDVALGRLNRHLLPFLSALKRKMNIRIVLSAATHYAHDYLWGQALNQIGVAYVVLHRECNKASKYQRDYWQNYWSKMPSYEAHSILVHNEPCREMFVNSGITNRTRCHAFGALRMDDFAKRLKSEDRSILSDKVLLFFSFFPGVSLPNSDMWRPNKFGFTNLFEQAHRSYFRFLHNNPNVEGILKLKWMGGDCKWERALNQCLLVEGLTDNDLPNLFITAEGAVADLVQKSSAVIAFGSTTMLEAAVSGKPVIVPNFAEAKSPEMSDKVLYRENLTIFHCARSETELEKLMMRGAAGELKPNACAAQEVFETWVAPLDGQVVSRHVAYFDNIIAAKDHS